MSFTCKSLWFAPTQGRFSYNFVINYHPGIHLFRIFILSLCSLGNFGRHIVITLSVCPFVPLLVPYISPIFFEVGIPNLVCECILGWESFVYHFRFTVTLNLTYLTLVLDNRVLSISLILFEVGIPNLVCGRILG